MKFNILCILLSLAWQQLLAQEFDRYKSSFDTSLVSEKLGYQKKLSITLPVEYQSSGKSPNYPLIIIFDSQNSRSYTYLLNTIDYLTANEQMPASVIIGVESDMQNRYGETQLEISDSNAFGSKNEDFILEELIPFARQNFQTLNYNLLIGHSRYGYFTTYLFSRNHPEIQAVISASPVFAQKNLSLIEPIKSLNNTYRDSIKKYLRFGIGNDYPEDFEIMDEALKGRKNENENLSIEGYLFKDADHNVTPGLTVGRALYEIFEFWSKQQNTFIKSNENLTVDYSKSQEKISKHYGAELKLSLGILNGKAWDYYNTGKYEEAIEAWQLTHKNYPTFSEALLFELYALMDLKRDYSKIKQTLIEELKASEMYSPAEKAEIFKELVELENELPLKGQN
jgi:predicted alpha/beta superfamily hydrolase